MKNIETKTTQDQIKPERKSNLIPLLSICSITYNHENFIREALDSFLMQKTTFPFEIIINDDASTDNTAKIIREYEINYPDIVKGIYQTENQYSKGVRGIMAKFTFPRAQGKYIALCEGDDYWTDPYKLQKQVDFLEANREFAICHHGFDTYIENQKTFIPSSDYYIPLEYDIETLSKWNSIGTLSVMFRNFTNTIPPCINNIPAGDYLLHLWNASGGKIKYFPEAMAVYRKHKKSVTGDFKEIEGSMFIINILREIISAGFITNEKALLNLKAQLINSYLVLLAHFHHLNDRISFLKYFLELQLLKNAYHVNGVEDEKLIRYYIIHIQWSCVNSEKLETENLITDFTNLQMQSLLKETIQLIKQNAKMKSSKTFVLGNKIKRILGSIFF